MLLLVANLSQMLSEKLKKTLPVLALLLIPILYFYPFAKGMIPYPGETLFTTYSPWRNSYPPPPDIPFTFQNYHVMDAVRQIYPWQQTGFEIIKNGQWPLWNPYVSTGAPLLANNQSSLVYPLNILFMLFEFPIAWGLMTILQPILASIFVYFLLREYRIRPWISSWGAILFAWSGFYSVFIHNHPLGHTLLWLPLTILSLHKLSRKLTPLWISILSISIALLFTAGYIQIAVYSLIVILLYYLILLRPNNSKNNTITIIGLIIFGVGIASLQLLPSLEYILDLERDATWYDSVLLMPVHLLRLINPHILGHPITKNFIEGTQARMFSFYIGPIGLLFAFISIVKRYKNKIVMFWMVALFTILIFSVKNPVSVYLFDTFKFLGKATPQRALSITNLSLAILSSFGLEFIWKLKNKVHKKFILYFVIFSLATTILSLYYYSSLETAYAFESFPFIIIPLIALFSGIFILFLGKTKIIKSFRISIVVLCVIGVGELVFEHALLSRTFTQVDRIFPDTKLTEFLNENVNDHRFLSLNPWTLPPNTFIPYSLRSINVYDPAQYSFSHEFAETWRKYNNPDSEKFTRAIEFQKVSQNLIDITDVKYVLSSNTVPGKYLKLIEKIDETYIYENINYPTYAYLIDEAVIIATVEETVKTLSDSNFDPREIVILDKLPTQKVEKGEGKVTILNRTTQSSTFEIESTSNQFLFISESYNPGWIAKIDSKRAELYRANWAFQALFIPEGKHIVTISYLPKLFIIGLWISLISIISVLIIAVVNFFISSRNKI